MIPVPGNHDLLRPKGLAVKTYGFFDEYARGAADTVRLLEDTFWGQQPDVSLIEPLFAAYQEWFAERILPELEQRAAVCHVSHFPGDLFVELRIEGAFPICTRRPDRCSAATVASGCLS